MIPNNELYDLQYEMESFWQDEGMKQQAKKLQDAVCSSKDLTDIGPGAIIFQQVFVRMYDALLEKISATVGRPSVLDKILESVIEFYTNPVTQDLNKAIEELAMQWTMIGLRLTLTKVIRYTNRPSLQALQVSIGKAVYVECEDARVRYNDPVKFQRLLTKHQNKPVWKLHQSLDKLREELDPLWFQPTGMNDDIINSIGAFIMDILISTDVMLNGSLVYLFEIDTLDRQSSTKKPMYSIRFSDRVANILEDLVEEVVWSKPLFRPMIVPPLFYQSVTDSAYLKLDRPMIVKKSHPRLTEKLQQKWDGNTNVTRLLSSVNYLGQMEWRICDGMLPVVEDYLGTGLCGFPLVDPDQMVLPDEPVTDNEDHWKIYRSRVAKEYKKFKNNKGKAQELVYAYHVAQQFSVLDKFYYPHHVDWRMRTYPISYPIQPQGSDIIKSLLEFYEPKAIGDGVRFLKRNLASYMGKDKDIFEVQEKWVDDNSSKIIECAEDYSDTLFWHEADKPMMFLRAAREYHGYTDQGADYQSHLPITIDATCSVLQHMSALTKDEKTAKLVNLIPNQNKYYDAYEVIRVGVENELKDQACPTATLLSGQVTRSMVKHPVMTSVYASTPVGQVRQIEDALNKLDDKLPVGQLYLKGFDNHEAAQYLMPIIRKLNQEHFPGVFAYMEWLKSVVDVFKLADVEPWLMTAFGLEIPLFSHKFHKKRVKNRYADTTIFLTLQSETVNMDKFKTKNGISANTVHAIDSTHCHMIVNRCAEEGMAVTVVHDSFGCHADDMNKLRSIIWDTFCEIYENYSMLVQYEYFKDQLPAKYQGRLSKPPEEGDWTFSRDNMPKYFVK